MAGFLQDSDANGAGRTLETVCSAEQLAEAICSLGTFLVLLQSQQVAVERLEVVLQLFQKGCHQPFGQLFFIHEVTPSLAKQLGESRPQLIQVLGRLLELS